MQLGARCKLQSSSVGRALYSMSQVAPQSRGICHSQLACTAAPWEVPVVAGRGHALALHVAPPCTSHSVPSTLQSRVLPPLCVTVCHRVCCRAQTRLAPTESNHVSRVLCFLIFQIPIPGWQQPRGGLAAIPHRSDCPAVPVPWGQLHFISPRPGAALPPLILSCVIIMRDHHA